MGTSRNPSYSLPNSPAARAEAMSVAELGAELDWVACCLAELQRRHGIDVYEDEPYVPSE
jgi:hypothetical protein